MNTQLNRNPDSVSSRFDPSEVARKLGKAQRRVVLSLTDEWGEAADHRCAQRMFYGVGEAGHTIVHHRHRTDNCWRLTPKGMLVKQALEATP